MSDPLRNPKDPLLKTGPDKQMEMFRACVGAVRGAEIEDVLAVALSLIINGVRQGFATHKQAELRYDELMARGKEILSSHYDANGRKRGVFPYDQVVIMRRPTEPRN